MYCKRDSTSMKLPTTLLLSHIRSDGTLLTYPTRGLELLVTGGRCPMRHESGVSEWKPLKERQGAQLATKQSLLGLIDVFSLDLLALCETETYCNLFLQLTGFESPWQYCQPIEWQNLKERGSDWVTASCWSSDLEQEQQLVFDDIIDCVYHGWDDTLKLN